MAISYHHIKRIKHSTHQIPDRKADFLLDTCDFRYAVSFFWKERIIYYHSETGGNGFSFYIDINDDKRDGTVSSGRPKSELNALVNFIESSLVEEAIFDE